jgi:hypothetical protein
MRTTAGRALALVVSVGLWSAPMVADARLDSAVAQSEGRRKAAENGLRGIKAKSAAEAEQVHNRYAEAASTHNAWLDAVCQAIQQGAGAAPDVSGAATAAASALVEWVKVRNKPLGVAELNEVASEVVRKTVVADLTTIADGASKAHRSKDEQKRARAVADLQTRLQWKAFEDVK